MLPIIALDIPSSRSLTPCHLPILRSPGELVVQRPLVLWHLYRNHTQLNRADSTTWRQTRYNYSPWEAHHPGAGRGRAVPATRPSMVASAERAISPRLFPHPPRGCQYLTWRLRPLPLLCVRACVWRRWLRGQVGAACCCFWFFRGRRRCPAVLGCGACEARGSQPFGSPSCSARGLAGRRASAWPRAPRGRAGAREGKRRGRRVSRGPGRPGDVDA